MDKIKAVTDILNLILNGFQAGIPVFGILKTGFDEIKAGLAAKNLAQVTEALDAAAAEDLDIIARAQAEQKATS
jgi:hypothetical protein